MSDQELLYKIWEEVKETKINVAVVKDRQDAHITRQDNLVKDHYKLKEDFNLHKNKFLLIAGSIGSVFGLITTALYNWLKN